MHLWRTCIPAAVIVVNHVIYSSAQGIYYLYCTNTKAGCIRIVAPGIATSLHTINYYDVSENKTMAN